MRYVRGFLFNFSCPWYQLTVQLVYLYVDTTDLKINEKVYLFFYIYTLDLFFIPALN